MYETDLFKLSTNSFKYTLVYEFIQVEYNYYIQIN